jgi:RNA polymerase I-specific transcription initiation factor RRN3
VSLTDDQVEINNNLEEEEDDDVEDDEDEDDIAPMLSSSLTLDPFDLLTSQDIPKAASDEDDDSDGESDVDPGDVSSADGDRTDEDTQDEMKLLNQAEKKRQAVKAMREKLDGMLFHFFRHLQEYMGDGESIGQSAAEMAAERLGNGGLSSGQSTPTSEAPIHFPSSVPIITSRPAPTPAQSLAHFQTLLSLFSRQILPTSSTQHIPFLLFLCASFSHAHTDLFLGLLVSQALYASTTASPSAAAQPVSQAQRIAATVYIGSVVCRARFVTDESARQVLTYLLAYIDGKLRQSHLTKKIDELPLFYAVCQAVMLIFCFRWRAFTTEHKGEGESVVGELELEMDMDDEGEGDGKWIKDLDVLQRAITSELNPLLGCNTTVVNTFAKVAHHTNFAYCFSIIEANQQSTTRSTSSHSLSAQANGGSENGQLRRQPSTRQNSTSASYSIPRKARQSNIDAGLDSYYPFDPFTLPRSKQYIDNLYRTWGEVSIPLDDESDDDDDESEDAEETEDDSLDEMDTSRTRVKPISLPKGSSWNEARRRLVGSSRRDDGLSSSLEGMSISPAHAGFMKR